MIVFTNVWRNASFSSVKVTQFCMVYIIITDTKYYYYYYYFYY